MSKNTPTNEDMKIINYKINEKLKIPEPIKLKENNKTNTNFREGSKHLKKSMSSQTLKFSEFNKKPIEKKTIFQDPKLSPVLDPRKIDSQITNTSTTSKSIDKFKNQHSLSECSSCTSSNFRCKYEKLKIVFEVEKDVIKIQKKVREFLAKLKIEKSKRSQKKRNHYKEIISKKKKTEVVSKEDDLKKKEKKLDLSNICEENITLDSPQSQMCKLDRSQLYFSDSEISGSSLQDVTYNSIHTNSISDESNCSLNLVY